MKKRLMAIVELLLDREEYLTVNKIASNLKVSNKTIRNDLIILEEWLKEHNLDLYKKTGSGVIIYGDSKDKLNIKYYINSKTSAIEAYSPQDRKKYILNNLFMKDSTVRIKNISKELHVSRATVHKDLIEIVEFLKKNNITLIRNSNIGMYLEGKERDIRFAISELTYKNSTSMEVKELLLENNNILNNIPSIQLFKAFYNYDFKKLEEIIFEVISVDRNTITDEALTRCLINIAIAMKRIQIEKNIRLSEEFKQELLKKESFKYAEDICSLISKRFNIKFDLDEKCYLSLYIEPLTKKIIKKKSNDNEEVELYKNVTKKIIEYWSKILELELKSDEELFASLAEHMKSVIHRAEYGFVISNPVLEVVKNNFEYTYKAAKESNYIFKELVGTTLNDDEIGYIALYLIAAIDRAKMPLKTILVCHGSKGVSHLILQRLKQEFNQIEIIDSIPASSVAYTNFEEIDLIISTIPIIIDSKINIVNINSILNKTDILNLIPVIKKLYSEKNGIVAYR